MAGTAAACPATPARKRSDPRAAHSRQGQHAIKMGTGNFGRSRAPAAPALFSRPNSSKKPGACRPRAFLVPVVGVEPTRVISTRDFESPSSAIPTHRLIFHVIIAYLARKIKRKVSLSFRRAARRRPAAQTGAPGGDFALWPRRASGGVARGIDGLISGRDGASFFKKDFTNDTQLYII